MLIFCIVLIFERINIVSYLAVLKDHYSSNSDFLQCYSLQHIYNFSHMEEAMFDFNLRSFFLSIRKIFIIRLAIVIFFAKISFASFTFPYLSLWLISLLANCEWINYLMFQICLSYSRLLLHVKRTYDEKILILMKIPKIIQFLHQFDKMGKNTSIFIYSFLAFLFFL